MPAVFDHRHTVTADEIDALGHANNLRYLKWTLAAAVAHSAEQGWASDAYRALGAGFVVRRHQIEYLRPALEGDEVLIRTWVANMKRVTSLRRYQIWRVADQRTLATAETDWAFVDFATGKPKRIPPEVSGKFPVVTDPPGSLTGSP